MAGFLHIHACMHAHVALDRIRTFNRTGADLLAIAIAKIENKSSHEIIDYVYI